MYDLSDSTHPRELGSYPANALAAEVSGDYVYLGGNFLEIVEISDPLHPRRAGIAPLASKGLKISGNRAYLMTGRYVPLTPNTSVERGRVEIVDVSNPASPRLLGRYDTQGTINALDVSENYLYVAEDSFWDHGSGLPVNGALHLVDASDPASPKRLGEQLALRPPSSVAIVGKIAFVAEAPVWDGVTMTGGGVRTLDISDPRDPQLLADAFANREWSGYSLHLVAAQHRLCILGAKSQGSDMVWRLQSFDVSNPRNPQPGAVHSGMGQVSAVDIDGEYGFVLERQLGGNAGYLVTLGLQQPHLFRNATTGSAADLVQWGDHIYLADREAGLEILDTSNPAAVRRVGQVRTKGTTESVAVDDRTLYVADTWQTESGSRSELAILDLANPAEPQRIGTYEAAFPISYIFVRDHFAYVGGPRRLEIIDVVDGRNPKLRGATTTIGFGKFMISGDHAYMVPLGGYGYLQLIDVSQASNPEPAAQLRIGNLFTASIGVVPGFAYLATGGALEVFDTSTAPNLRRASGQLVRGLSGASFGVSGRYASMGTHLFDMSRPQEPEAVAAFQGYALSVAFTHDRLHLASGPRGLEIRDVRPANPQRVGTYVTSGIGSGWRSLVGAVSRNHALVATWVSGALVLEVVDLSNPNQPRKVAQYAPVQPYIQEILISGEYVWLVGYSAFPGSGLEVFQVTNPAAPERMSYSQFNQWISTFAVAGGRAYVVAAPSDQSTTNGGLLVFDVSHPATPRQIGRFDLVGGASHVAALGDVVYAVDPIMGLSVIDVSDPTRPQQIGRHTGFSPYRIEISQTKAILIDGKPGLVIFDVSTPSRPVQVGRYDTDWGTLRMASGGDYVYLVGASDPGTGLDVVDIKNPVDPKRVGGNSSIQGHDVAMAGDHVLVAGEDRVWVLDRFQPALWLTAWPASGTNLLTLRVDLPDDRIYQLQRSTDLRNWEDWKGVSRTVAPLRIPDVPAAASSFYRLRQMDPVMD